MAALVIIRNDGPDAAEIRFGRSRRVLHAGQEFRLATSMLVDVCAVPSLTPQEMAMHMGAPLMPNEPCRFVDGE